MGFAVGVVATSRTAQADRPPATETGDEPDADEPTDLRALSTFPVPGAESSGYGWRDDPKTKRRRFHSGADIRADRGTPVYASGAGVVVFAARKGGYGRCIIIDHGGGLTTRYAHLASFQISEGDVVDAGQLIGEVGSSGRTTGPHLHFEVRLLNRPVDPNAALEVATLQRVDPAAAMVAAAALTPEVSAKALDRHDERNARRARAVSRKQARARSRALW